jgi:group II intron reverse transcriptase/maturase
MKGETGNDGKEPGISMMTGAAEGRVETPGANQERSGRKPQGAGIGAASITGRSDNSIPEAERLMEAIVSRGNMMAAYSKVVANKGAPGVDRMPVTELKSYLQEHWPRIKEELLAGKYVPLPVLRVEIPKPDGGIRILGIPVVLDRLIQQGVNQVLGALFIPDFSKHSYGYMPGRSAHQAVQAARKYVAEGKRWVVDIDLEKFFDRVNHDILMSLVKRKVKDRMVLKLIDSYLKAGMFTGGTVSQRQEGTPQGSPLSPLLSNILLDELDKELEKRSHEFCRYADDCNIYVATEASGERVMASITRFLSEQLKLTVNQAKSAVDRPWRRIFLGYSMNWYPRPRLRAGTKAVAKFKATVREICRRGRGRSMQQVIEEINPKLRGWLNYFRYVESDYLFKELDGWLRRKLRVILWKQWKRTYTRAKNLTKLGLSSDAAWRFVRKQRGPWAIAGTNVMNRVLNNPYFEKLGLVSLLNQYLRLQRVS